MVETTRSMRTRQYKLIRNFRRPTEHAQSRATLAPQRAATFAAAVPLELYDLERDPLEFHNCAGNPAYAAVRDQLDARLWDFLLDYNDFLVNEPVHDDWQAETRRTLAAHCTAHNRALPAIDH